MKKLRLSFRELNWSKAVELVRGRALLLLTLMLLFPKGKGGRIDKEKESASEVMDRPRPPAIQHHQTHAGRPRSAYLTTPGLARGSGPSTQSELNKMFVD